MESKTPLARPTPNVATVLESISQPDEGEDEDSPRWLRLSASDRFDDATDPCEAARSRWIWGGADGWPAHYIRSAAKGTSRHGDMTLPPLGSTSRAP